MSRRLVRVVSARSLLSDGLIVWDRSPGDIASNAIQKDLTDSGTAACPVTKRRKAGFSSSGATSARVNAEPSGALAAVRVSKALRSTSAVRGPKDDFQT